MGRVRIPLKPKGVPLRQIGVREEMGPVGVQSGRKETTDPWLARERGSPEVGGFIQPSPRLNIRDGPIGDQPLSDREGLSRRAESSPVLISP